VQKKFKKKKENSRVNPKPVAKVVTLKSHLWRYIFPKTGGKSKNKPFSCTLSALFIYYQLLAI